MDVDEVLVWARIFRLYRILSVVTLQFRNNVRLQGLMLFVF